MRLKLYRLRCKLLSKILHLLKNIGLGTSFIEYLIEQLCKKHNDLVDVKRGKIQSPKIAIQKYPYITIWQYIWDLDEEGKMNGKIYTDTSVDNEEQ